MPAMAGGSPEADNDPIPLAAEVTPGRDAAGRPSGGRCPLVLVPTGIAAAATVVFGIVPSPLVDWASNAGEALFIVVS
jgi:hypothetical protein